MLYISLTFHHHHWPQEYPHWHPEHHLDHDSLLKSYPHFTMCLFVGSVQQKWDSKLIFESLFDKLLNNFGGVRSLLWWESLQIQQLTNEKDFLFLHFLLLLLLRLSSLLFLTYFARTLFPFQAKIYLWNRWMVAGRRSVMESWLP